VLASADNMKLQITNVERSVSEEELKKLFEAYGQVSECTIVLDKTTGKSKGFGFVTMDHEPSAREAVAGLNGRVVNEMKIKVKRL